MGQGVEIESITRVRDQFLDTQFRIESSIDGEVEFAAEVFRQLEGIIGEPSDTGIAQTLQSVFDSLQDLQVNPENLSARTAFLQQAVNLQTVFQQQGQQLLNLHANLVGVAGTPASFPNSQLGITTDEVNTQLGVIASLNTQINTVISAGGAPNDLLDQRDQLLDELSETIGITVEPLPNSQVRVSIGGEEFLRGPTQLRQLSLVTNTGANQDRVPALVEAVDINTPAVLPAVDITATISGGEIRGILDIAGFDTSQQNVYETFEDLNSLFTSIAASFNTVHQAGRDINGNIHNVAADPLFEIFITDPAATPGQELLAISVNQNLLNDPGGLGLAADDAAFPGNFAGQGDNRNALAFLDLRDTTQGALGNLSFENFLQDYVASLGTDSRAFQDREFAQGNLVNSLDNRRQSVSGVNIDEETIDLIRFQRAFEASSRVISVFNEIYQTIINSF